MADASEWASIMEREFTVKGPYRGQSVVCDPRFVSSELSLFHPQGGRPNAVVKPEVAVMAHVASRVH